MERLRRIGRRILAITFTILTLGLVDTSAADRRAASRDEAPIVDVERPED